MGKKFTKFGLTQSKMSKFLRCPFSYDCHYNKKIRPIKDGSALMFGIAIDDMLNGLLLGESKERCHEIFKETITRYELGSVVISSKDFDDDIINDRRRDVAQKFLKKKFKIDKPMKIMFKEIYDKQKDKKKLTKQEEKIIDYIARVSLFSKSEIILDAYEEQVMPRIKKVHAVQKSSKQGILDLKADIDKIGNTHIVDNKTSVSEYDEKATDNSVQLILYAVEEKCNKVMFIVIPKVMKKKKVCKVCNKECNTQHKTCNETVNGKRCHGEFTYTPYIDIQFVPGKVTKKMRERAKEIQDGIEKLIESEQFVCNFANCNNQFGRPCDYKELYWKGDMSNLEVKK